MGSFFLIGQIYNRIWKNSKAGNYSWH